MPWDCAALRADPWGRRAGASVPRAPQGEAVPAPAWLTGHRGRSPGCPDTCAHCQHLWAWLKHQSPEKQPLTAAASPQHFQIPGGEGLCRHNPRTAGSGGGTSCRVPLPGFWGDPTCQTPSVLQDGPMPSPGCKPPGAAEQAGLAKPPGPHGTRGCRQRHRSPGCGHTLSPSWAMNLPLPLLLASWH